MTSHKIAGMKLDLENASWAIAASRRQRTARCMALVLSLAMLAIVGCGERSKAFDNVVLVTLDTLRADHLGCYGYPRQVSPFLDSLAAKGLKFERALSSSSHTGPAHASLFTSQYPTRHRVLINGVKLAESIPTMAGFLGTAGFDTAAFVSVRFLNSVSHGFEVLDNDVGDEQHRAAGLTVDAALEWFERRPAEGRAFVWVHLFDAHQTGRRHDVPERQLQEMRADSRQRASVLRPHWIEHHGITAAELDGLVERIDRYDAQIAYVDAELKRLFESIESRDANNLWVIAADHGEALGDHGYVGHGMHLYEEQLRVPLLLYGGDGWPRGGTIERMVRHVDLLPTMLELAGVPAEPTADFEGRSFVDLLDNPRAPVPRIYAFSQRRPPDPSRWRKYDWERGLVLAAQSERYKYILHSNGEDEFYDLETDPHERNNLAGRETPESDELADWLARKYEAMLAAPLGGSSRGGDLEIDRAYLDELRALGYL
jgi:arylsulfatase A-like enzyme